MSHYTPRKRKVQSTKVKGAQKLVRVDHRTQIMVDVDIPDDVARERYLARINQGVRESYIPIPIAEIKPPEIMPLSSLEQLQQIIAENTELPEEE